MSDSSISSRTVIPVAPGPWDDRFRGLPTFPVPTGVLMPAHDGDMAELEELADRVLAAGPAGSVLDVVGLIEYDIDTYLEPWPPDHAGELIAAWKREGIPA